MKEKLLEASYFYRSYYIKVEHKCGFAVKYKYSNLFECYYDVMYDRLEILKKCNVKKDINFYAIDDSDENDIFWFSVDINDHKSILKYLMGCIDSHLDQ
jgi:hypothetical protein